MEVIGNIGLIKASIERKYDKEIDEIDKETEKEIELLKDEANKKISLQRARIKTYAESESKKAHSKIVSEGRLKAKKEFEEAREGFIKGVFSEALKKAKMIAHSKRYVDFVKERMPEEDGVKEGVKIIGDSEFYKKHFGDVIIDDAIIGVKLMAKDVIYDLSLDGILTSKRELLRHKISKELFEK